MKAKELKLKELKERQEQELKSLEFEYEMKELFSDYKILAFAKPEKRLIFQDISIYDFNSIINLMPSTSIDFNIKYTGKEEKIYFPYRFDIKNPCQINRYSKFQLNISYFHKDISVCIEINLSEILEDEKLKKYFIKSYRSITSSEYHYFTGVSRKRLNEMKVSQYSFNCNNYVSWYGGDKTLKSVNMYEDIFMVLEQIK